MNAIELLGSCRAADNEIRILEQRLRRLREVATSAAPPELMSGGRSTAERDHTGSYVATAEGIQKAIEARRLLKTRQEVACALMIDEILDGEREPSVIFGYYVKRQSIKEIAADLHISQSRVKNVKTEALERLKMLNEIYVMGLFER